MKELSWQGFCRYIMSRYKLPFLSDAEYVKYQYYLRFHEHLNLQNPTSFNEKIQWLKLYDRNPQYSQFVDKYAVREYIQTMIGKQYLVPLLGTWKSVKDVDVAKLPQQFVIKTTHDSGGCVVCRNKSAWDSASKRKISKSLKRDYYWFGREWPYKNVPHRIIAEQYLSSENGDMIDYKLMCFNGKVKCILVCTDRLNGKGLKKTFYSPTWERMPFKRPGPDSPKEVPVPKNLADMIRIAEHLSEGLSFIRVDLYEVGDTVYFGELTLYPSSGAEAFCPPAWDRILGDWITLPGLSEFSDKQHMHS